VTNLLLLAIAVALVAHAAQLHCINRKIKHMSQLANDVKNAEAALAGKIDLVLTALAGQKQQITDLQNQIANLPLSPDDAAALQASLADMQAKADQITAALSPPAPAP